MRNKKLKGLSKKQGAPLQGMLKASPVRGGGSGELAGLALEGVKPLVGTFAKRALGLAGMFLNPTTTSDKDQPKDHGGPTDEEKYPGGKIKFGS